MKKLASGFQSLYMAQSHRDFFGLRDFYYFIRQLRRVEEQKGHIVQQDIMAAVERQFGGGRKVEWTKVRCCFKELIPAYQMETTALSLSNQFPLICDNLNDRDARHLMVISRGSTARHILVEEYLQKQSLSRKVCILEGGHFPADKSERSLQHYLLRIKECMREGNTLVLVGMDCIYECLYDVLNGRSTQVGSSHYVRIVVGSQSEACLIDPKFKVIVIAEPAAVYQKMPSPFLNRFEKHTLAWADIVLNKEASLELQEWVSDLDAICSRGSGAPKHCFLGYHRDIPYSLVALALHRSSSNQHPTKLCKSLLMWMVRPESLVSLHQYYNSTEECSATRITRDQIARFVEEYLSAYHISSLQDLMDRLGGSSSFETWKNDSNRRTSGHRFTIYTYSPCGVQLDKITAFSSQATQMFNLSHLESQEHFYELLTKFWLDEQKTNLVVQCSLEVASPRLVMYCQRLCYETEQRALKGLRNVTKHIFIIVHMSTAAAKSSAISISFESSWNNVFIDCLTPAPAHMFSLQQLLDVDHWASLYLNGSMDCMHILESYAPKCVAEMNCKYVGTFFTAALSICYKASFLICVLLFFTGASFGSQQIREKLKATVRVLLSLFQHKKPCAALRKTVFSPFLLLLFVAL